MIEHRKFIRGSVKLLRCSNCSSSFPIFDFEVESDAELMGLCSAGVCNELKIAIFDLAFEEWKKYEKGERATFPPAIERELNAGDYKTANILRVEPGKKPPLGLSFLEFRKQYRSPTIIYSCPCCRGGESKSIEEMTVQAFRAAGGKLVLLGDLVLAS